MANPDPEISYDLACQARSDAIVATGRSDHPNQVNNVLCFPYLFRGALDVRAVCINEAMKLAAVRALAALAKAPVPEVVARAYGVGAISFGKDYLIPKPLDSRLLTSVAPAVARAAMDSGVSRLDIYDWKAYANELQDRIGLGSGMMDRIVVQASKAPISIAFSDAYNANVLKATRMMIDEDLGKPVLLGHKQRILECLHDLGLSSEGYTFVDPQFEERQRKGFAEILFEKRKRKGMTLRIAQNLLHDAAYFGVLMLEGDKVDAFMGGIADDYANVLRQALRVVGADVLPSGARTCVSGMYILSSQDVGTYFLADTSINIEPNAEELLQIITHSVGKVRYLGYEPRVALLSYANFGMGKDVYARRVQEVLRLTKKHLPDVLVDGDLQADIALSPHILQEVYPFSALKKHGANTLIFPSLASANIAYKLLKKLGQFEAIGPILMGLRKPMHVLHQGATVREIFNMIAMTSIDLQARKNKNT